MGSGLSILPEFLTEEEVKRIARGKFNQATFDSLKTFDGLISREDFMNALQSAQENDIEVLFQKFCPNGQMESKTFVKMMRDTKMLNSKFTNADADIIFQKTRVKLGAASKAIPYELFRLMAVPDIALKRGSDLNDLLFELSRAEGPSSTGTTADDVRLHAAPVRRNSDASRAAQLMPKLADVPRSSSTLTGNDACSDDLLPLFMQFCPSGEMDSRTFAKMMGDCRVIDKSFTSGDCDIVFQKVKFAVANAPSEGAYTASSQATKINFDHFSRIALLSVAEKKNMSMSALVRGMAQCSGPIVHGTTPDAVRFHDDTNTYPTGSLAASRTLEHSGAGELSPQKSTEGTKATEAKIVKLASVDRRNSFKAITKLTSVDELSPTEVPPGIENLFTKYCPQGDMDSRTFIKMVKDCNLLDSRFGTGDVDILFQKAKTREAGGVNVAGQKVGFRTFVGTVLPGIAAKKGCTNQDLIRVLMKSEGPQLTNVTEVEKVRFHDDTTTYPTGSLAAARTLELTSSSSPVKSLKSMEFAAVDPSLRKSSEGLKKEEPKIVKLASMDKKGSSRAITKHTSVDELSLTEVPPGIEYLFTKYCPQGDMDSRTFIKMVKDCNLLDSRFGTGDVDILFQKAKTREAGGVNVAGQKVGFRTFVGTVLPGIAAKKGCTNQDLIRVLMKSEGPQLTNVTEVEKVRFHDDRSTYTGTHAV